MDRLRLGLVGLFVALVAGCVTDGDRTLVILNNKPPESDCTVSAEEGGFYLSSGVLDLETSTQPYIFTPIVRSDAEFSAGEPNGNLIFFEGADVVLEDTATDASRALIMALTENWTGRTHYFSGSVDPGGIAVVKYPLIDREQANEIAGHINAGHVAAPVMVRARSRIFGNIDGSQIASPYFTYPIDICIGCVPLPDPLDMDDVRCFGDQY